MDSEAVQYSQRLQDVILKMELHRTELRSLHGGEKCHRGLDRLHFEAEVSVVGAQRGIIVQQTFKGLHGAVEPTLKRTFLIALGAEVTHEEVALGVGRHRAVLGEEAESRPRLQAG
jgi:hypothetical protein